MISHNPPFVFVHLTKTAGTSIDYTLKHLAEIPKEKHKVKHETILQLLKQCKKDPAEYFKFTTVRNPFDRLVSNYFYRVERLKDPKIIDANMSFSEWVTGEKGYSFKDTMVKRTMHSWISDEKGNLLMDYVIRFEKLQEGFSEVCAKLGLPAYELPHTFKTKHNHYSSYYSPEAIDCVYIHYKKDLESFGYKYNEQ
jgi:chondroitin 4-sulfotransferase 11